MAMVKSEIYPLYEYETVKNSYIKKIKTYMEGQYKFVATKVINDITNYAISLKSSPYLIEDHLDQALDLLLDLRHALNDKDPIWNQHEKIEVFYNDVVWSNNLEPWIYSPEYRINIASLNEVISKYIQLNWFSSPTFEWYLINGYLGYVIDRNRTNYIHHSPFSPISLASITSKKTHYQITYPILSMILFYLIWIKTPTLAFEHLIKGEHLTGFGIVGFLLVYCTYLFKRKKQKKELLNLINVKQYTSAKLWSPSILMEKVKKIDKHYFIPELIPLISKLKLRSPHIFNIESQ